MQADRTLTLLQALHKINKKTKTMRIEPALARYHSASDKSLSLRKTGVQCLTRYIFLLEKLIYRL